MKVQSAKDHLTLLPETITHRSTTVIAAGGESVFYLPIDNYFFAGPAGECEVRIDGVEQTFGVDFAYRTFGAAFGQAAGAVDIGIGIALTAPAAPGQAIVLSWLERLIQHTPAGVSAVRAIFTGAEWTVDPGVIIWNQSSIVDMPNGVLVPGLPSPYVTELWRMTRKTGGRPPAHPTRRRYNTRFVPYFRATYRENGIYGRSEFATGNYSHWRRFRARVYNPFTGARSPFSPETICVTRSDEGSGRPDVHSGAANPGAGNPCRYGIWINR